ncbi:myosin-10 isoform X19 [Bombus pyrosoma]|uniref:myosin-10 isoform X19 n=1 Tax=Bombus pyrosoma TaxID=396416 RepID=UPI001CB97C29|nr:myosin-10 isoform X19 [Bombus pyrosoma]
MAEVATKKSINVLDNLTASNKQLISLCDNNDDEDDLILTNNTRNELDTDDKSLQELIESELALRICSSTEEEAGIESDEQQETMNEPEAVKRIVLDIHQEEDVLDVNAKFIVAETEHSELMDKSYSYQNGHMSPETKISNSSYEENVKPEPITGFRDEEEEEEDQVEEEQAFNEQSEVGSTILVEETTTREIDQLARDTSNDGKFPQNEDDEDPRPNYPVLRPTEATERLSEVTTTTQESFESSYEYEQDQVITIVSTSYVDKYQQEQEVQGMIFEYTEADIVKDAVTMEESCSRNRDAIDTWSEQTIDTEDRQTGQFSDKFDQSLCQEDVEPRTTEEFAKETVLESKKLADTFELVHTERDKEREAVEEFSVDEESKVSTNDKSSSSMEEKIPEDVEELSVPGKPIEESEEEARGTPTMQFRSFDDVTLSHSESSADAASTQEFLDTERRVLSEENCDQYLPEDIQARETLSIEKIDPPIGNLLEEEEEEEEEGRIKEEETKEETNDNMDEQNAITESSSELSVSEPTFIEKTEVVISESSVKIVSETQCLEIDNDAEPVNEEQLRNHELESPARAPLATPDDETSDVSNVGDSESREETITTSTSVVTSPGTKVGTKTKKKKIEGVAGNDASPNLTPRTKKTKKSKKNELEKENISVVGQNGDTNPNCRSCGKVVFQMEQTKAEGLVWHKNCFRCVQCSKQLNVDNYESHESTLYCKPHFKELFQPKPVEESDEPVRPRKPELIIRENEPKELPPDVVRASDKPDLGLEELSSLNVKSRFQVFEKAGTETNEIERSPSQIAVKRSPSILSKLAKFQAKGMDIGVADESLNGIPYEESSESEEEEEAEETEELDSEIVKAKRATRERPISFTKMDDIKNRWETTSQQGRREVQREARKEEIAGIRSRLFMGKQGKMKEMYQQAVAGSERVTKINAAEEIQHSTHARSIKERFERGEPIAASDDETDSKPKPEKADEEVIAAGISRKSRSLFLELDATAAKTGRPVTPVNPKTPAEAPRRARDAFMGRQVSDDVVRSSDATEEVQVETSDISNKFKFFESYKEPEKQRKQFRITPPRDGQVKMDSPEREIYRDPDVVRAEDRVNEVVHTDTARKMLSIFRQMEENACKKELPNGPKPLKRFTPPPEDKYAKPTASDSEEVEDEDGDESEGEDSTEERDPNYVRASDKVEDEFLKQAQNAARAKTLCAKFEHWEETDGKTTSSNQHIAEMEIAQNTTGEQQSIESASSLRARFESLGSQTNESPRTPKVKVNRFVEIQASCTDVCESCEKKVYPLEKVETNNKIFHKQCFRCQQCNCVLRMDTFTLNNGKLYCIPHFKQLFITRGNYDEGFGVDPHKNKWTTSSSNPTSPSPIAVSNGDL